jgi:hypothetical protein
LSGSWAQLSSTVNNNARYLVIVPRTFDTPRGCPRGPFARSRGSGQGRRSRKLHASSPGRPPSLHLAPGGRTLAWVRSRSLVLSCLGPVLDRRPWFTRSDAFGAHAGRVVPERPAAQAAAPRADAGR